MRKGTRIIAGLVAAPLLVGGLAACNKSDDTKGTAAKAAADTSKDAKTRFMEAMDATNDVKKQSVTMKFDVTPESVVKMAGAFASSSGSTSTPLDTKVAKLIATSKIQVDSQATGDKTLKSETDPAKLNMMMAWKTDSDLVNMAMAKEDLFLKLDLAKIGDQTGAFSMSDIQGQMAGAPDWAQDIVNGKWVGLSKDTMNSFAKSAGADVDAASFTPEQMTQLNEAAKKQLETNGTFTADGDDIKAEIKLKPFMTGFMADAKRIAPKQFTSSSTTDIDKSMEGLKADAKAVFSTSLEDGKIKSMKMDLGQITSWIDETKLKTEKDKKEFQDFKSKNITFPISLEYSEPGSDVSAPAGARMIKKEEIEQLTGGTRGSAPATPTP